MAAVYQIDGVDPAIDLNDEVASAYKQKLQDDTAIAEYFKDATGTEFIKYNENDVGWGNTYIGDYSFWIGAIPYSIFIDSKSAPIVKCDATTKDADQPTIFEEFKKGSTGIYLKWFDSGDSGAGCYYSTEETFTSKTFITSQHGVFIALAGAGGGGAGGWCIQGPITLPVNSSDLTYRWNAGGAGGGAGAAAIVYLNLYYTYTSNKYGMYKIIPGSAGTGGYSAVANWPTINSTTASTMTSNNNNGDDGEATIVYYRSDSSTWNKLIEVDGGKGGSKQYYHFYYAGKNKALAPMFELTGKHDWEAQGAGGQNVTTYSTPGYPKYQLLWSIAGGDGGDASGEGDYQLITNKYRIQGSSSDDPYRTSTISFPYFTFDSTFRRQLTYASESYTKWVARKLPCYFHYAGDNKEQYANQMAGGGGGANPFGMITIGTNKQSIYTPITYYEYLHTNTYYGNGGSGGYSSSYHTSSTDTSYSQAGGLKGQSGGWIILKTH